MRKVGVHVITGDEAVEIMGYKTLGSAIKDGIVEAESKSGYELRQERYRESNENKKARDLDRRQKRKNKRSQAY